jgi:pimeloyl-ACP methyl ester carboxylesterase
MDETYVRVGGQWKYLYRAVDRDGDTINFLLRAHRDHTAARRFFERAIELHGVPEKITVDKSGSNTVAVQSIRAHSGADIVLRQSKYLNKCRRTRPPGHQVNCATHARFQVLWLCAQAACRHLVASDDRMIPPPAQRAMATRAGATMTEMPGSHAVYVSRPQGVATLITEAAASVSH